MADVDAWEFDKDEGVSFSFCIVTGPPNYKKALLKPILKNACVNPPVHRSVPETRRSVDVSHIMKQSKEGCIDPNWVLLDNQSTVDVFYNHRLLKNIKEVDTWMDIHCNAGVTSTNLQGELPGYGTVCFHKDGIANILSLSKTAAKHRVTYGSVDGNEFRVHKDNGTTRVFRQSKRDFSTWTR
jgi:hypothetical protein